MRKKLNINIKEKVFFSEIEGYSIRVNEKDNNTLKDIIIYDHTDKKGVEKIFIAKSGKMSITNNNNHLLIELNNGKSYSQTINDEQEYILKTKFSQYNLALNLSSFKMERTESDRFSNRARTMNSQQLQNSLDSLKKNRVDLENQFLLSFVKYTNVAESMTTHQIRKVSENYKNQRNLITRKINRFNIEVSISLKK